MTTASIPEIHVPKSRRGEPVWDLALLYPSQGNWTEEEYLALDTNWLIELSDGCLEVHPMATWFHQFVLQFLFTQLNGFVQNHKLGAVAFAPLPVRLAPGKMREPDILFVRSERLGDVRQPPNGVDLAIEVVSEGKENRERDLVTKRREYAQAGIAEYWIVDDVPKTITVLKLPAGQNEYALHGEFGLGQQATSALLPGFAVDVAATFAAGEGPG